MMRKKGASGGLSQLLGQFQFARAVGLDLAAALELRREVYAAELGHVPEDETDTVADHFVAKGSDGRVVGAFMILGPKYRPFDFERYVDIASVVPQGRRAALIGRLCIRSQSREVRQSTIIQLGLLKLAYDFAVLAEISDLVLFTFPHLVPFYRGHCFSDTGETFWHPGYGQRMHVMHLDVSIFRDQQARSTTTVSKFLRTGVLDSD
jgi:predicted GNAT family N-acyltransferase